MIAAPPVSVAKATLEHMQADLAQAQGHMPWLLEASSDDPWPEGKGGEDGTDAAMARLEGRQR